VTALDNADLQSLEKFVKVMYDRSSADTSVNYARLNLFACKQRPYDAIPPSSLPSSYIQTMLPTKEELSGVKPLSLDLSQKVQLTGDGVGKKILWTDIPSVAASCQELTMQKWLQEGLLGEVQMSSLWAELYSFV